MKVGINGFGRIGRLVMRGWVKDPRGFEIVAVNDIGDPKTMVHLFKYDSTFGPFEGDVKLEGDTMVVNGHRVKLLSERNPENLPWKDMGVEYVIESTGLFLDSEKAGAHLKAGAKKVILSAPAKGSDIKTIVLGVNEGSYDPEKDHILSNASCTTNCLAPVAKVLHDNFKIKNGLMTTIHSYTNDQRILDLPHKDLRRARSAAMNLIPTTTGAARAIGLVMPDLKGKFDGLAIRVPTPDVSLVDLVAVVEKPTTIEEINAAVKKAAEGPMKAVLQYIDEPLVSMDFKGNGYSSIFDSGCTSVIDGTTVKVLSWYDNEWGYSLRVLDLIAYMMKKSPARMAH
jgi:glyceraldehyde 3-phosphate dehydrogenase